MDDICYFHHGVSESEPVPEAVQQDSLVITLTHEKIRGRVVIGDEFHIESRILIGITGLWVKFSRIKQFQSNKSIESRYTHKIAEALTSIGVPQAEHAAIIESVFLAVDALVSPGRDLYVDVWDMTLLRRDTEPGQEWRPYFIPAAKSSIEQLKHTVDQNTTISSCAICLEDFAAAAQGSTSLPCAHHYHLDCIVRWLKLSHLCPMCRYPMPTEQQDKQP